MYGRYVFCFFLLEGNPITTVYVRLVHYPPPRLAHSKRPAEYLEWTRPNECTHAEVALGFTEIEAIGLRSGKRWEASGSRTADFRKWQVRTRALRLWRSVGFSSGWKSTQFVASRGRVSLTKMAEEGSSKGSHWSWRALWNVHVFRNTKYIETISSFRAATHNKTNCGWHWLCTRTCSKWFTYQVILSS